MSHLHPFLCGALTVMSALIGLFFIRFYRTSRDRLFVFFALTFWVLGANWASLAFISQEQDNVEFYLPRLLAFLVLLIGIVDKNRRATRERRS